MLICLANFAHAENWTRFRGPNGSGWASETFPATWTDQDYQWKIDLPGVGHSSPVGWENRLFITTGDDATGEVTLHCFAADSGEQIWQQEFAGQTYKMHTSNSYASTTPTVDAQHVYLTWAAGGQMHCVALTHDGQEVWRESLGQFSGQHGFAASPVVVEGMLCIQVDHAEEGEPGFLVGMKAASGEIYWRAERPAGMASYATPCEAPGPDNRTAVISQSMTGGMQAIDVHTGESLWQFADVFPARTVSSPFLAGDTIIGVCGSGGAGKQLVGMQLIGRSSPVEKLLLTKHVPYVPTPLVVNKKWMFLWHDQGKVSCVDLQAENPSKRLWTKRIGGKFFGSPIVAGDKIYCLSTDGRVVVIAADKEFSLLGETDLGAPTYATPSVHQGRMYLRTESTLACLAQAKN